MVGHDSSLHHLHRRKRIHQKHEKYPHTIKWKKIVDKLIYVAVFLGPIFTLPQVLKIWIIKDAAGVSFISWSAYFFLNIIWITYGVAHRNKPIIIASILWLIVEIFILVGIMVYG